MANVLMLLAATAAATVAAAQAPPPVRGRVELPVVLTDEAPAAVAADVLVVPVFEGESEGEAVAPGIADAVRIAREQGAFDGELFESLSVFAPEGFAAKRLVLLGAGERDAVDSETFRRIAGVVMRRLRDEKVSSVAVHVRGARDAPSAARGLVEGALLGAFDAGLHKSSAKGFPVRQMTLLGLPRTEAVEAAIERGRLMADATNLARSLTVEPANYLTPEILAAHAKAIAREGGLDSTILDEKQIEARGMGGVIAVGKGSANPPRFIDLRYRPRSPSPVTIAFVGKGVCFDTGGISLKDGAGMYRMKGDMAGGAIVLAVMQIVSKLAPSVGVMGIVPAVENAPGPAAQKPGDVFVGLSGKTVEVMSTDAEGRLILSDGVTYAVREGATHIIDIATLTGTVRRALGDRHVGAFASDDDLFDKLSRAAETTGESFWRLPIDEEYASGIRSSLVADLNETGGDAGASVGAKFIQQFTEGKPWIHLDIAGMSWPATAPPYRGAGPTGVAVRTLAEMTLLFD